MKRIWVTWEIHRRSRSLAKELGATLIEIDDTPRGFLRYVFSIIRTLLKFRAERPDVIFVQNPSIVLALLAIGYGRCFRVPVIVDAHNAGLFPFEGRRKWATALATLVVRAAAITVVTNERLEKYVVGQGGEAFVLPDPIPSLHSVDGYSLSHSLKGAYNALYICTFALDEPYEEVLEAAGLINPEICVYVTGDRRRFNSESLRFPVPCNVVFTGFVPEEEYVRLLLGSDVVIDLTTRRDCLLCGAYEAVAAEKPLIVSDTEILRRHFSRGALYTTNRADDLARLIEKAIQERERLQAEIRDLKQFLLGDWKSKKDQFEWRLARIIHESRN